MDYILDDVIKEMEDIRHSPDICYACDRCAPESDQCFIQDAIGYLKAYKASLEKPRQKTLADYLKPSEAARQIVETAKREGIL